MRRTRHPRPIRRPRGLAAVVAVATAALLPLTGCRSAPEPATPVTYARPLPPGAPSLERIPDTAVRAELVDAFEARDGKLLDAIDASLRWFAAPSSRQAFPFTTGGLTVTHDRARQSVADLREILLSSGDGPSFADAVLARFEAWASVGWDGSGEVLFTGYYAPEFPASRQRSDRFRVAIHTRPDDLVTDPRTGEPQGRRRPDGGLEPYPTRGEILRRNLLAGRELAWVENEFDAFLIHVNGSARLRLDDGTDLYIGYAGKTDRPYRSLGKAMMREGLLGPDQASIPAMRRVFERRPADVIALMDENESYVFFTEYGGGEWPAGSLGVRVHPMASVATDKSVFPRGVPLLVDTTRRTFRDGSTPFVRLMLDQDTGGAITAPGRADLFMGTGAAAGILAGQQHATGRMIYLLSRGNGLAAAD
ncbi:MAG: murein transglycosylase A [Planctomycetota bacterium]|jgi:membrane-bound lytic murein transglycosylase A